MNEEWMKEMMEDIRMTDEKKSEVWGKIMRKAERRKVRKRGFVAAAVALLLLVIPVGVYAGSRFIWPWDVTGSGNGNPQMDASFKREYGSAEMDGYQFCVEQAFLDDYMGIAYCYVSITDVSGKNRNPKEVLEPDNNKLNVGDYDYSVGLRYMSMSSKNYDEVNSTKQTAYYYLEFELSQSALEYSEGMNDMVIHKCVIDEITESSEQGQKTTTGHEVEQTSFKIQNVVGMPAMTWKIKGKDGITEVRVSAISAWIFGNNDPTFQIHLNDGTVFKKKPGEKLEEGDKSFDSIDGGGGNEGDVRYIFEYTNIDKITGISLDGTFYPVSEAEIMIE